MSESYGLVSNNLPRVYNPPPGWDEELVSWQAKNVGWVPPTSEWTPSTSPGALPAPAGWKFWVVNPILVAQQRRQLTRKSLEVMAIGFGIFIVGLVLSLLGANLAFGGGTFIIFTGLMIVGLARVIFGLIRLVRAPSMAKDLVTNRKI